MSRHTSLRRARLAKRVSGADRAYYKDIIAPLLKEKYAELYANGQAPFYRADYESVMNGILMHTRKEGNIVFGNPEAFIYPPLNEAHKQGGDAALYTAFSGMLAEYNTRRNSFIENNPQELQIVLEAGHKIDRIRNNLGLRVLSTIGNVFKTAAEKGLVSKQAQIAYNTLMGIEPYFSHPMDRRETDPRGSVAVSADQLVAFHHHREKLLADMPPTDYGPVTVKAPALPEQTTVLTAPKLPPQKPAV